MAANSIWSPHSIDAVVQMIKERRVAKSLFLHILILRSIGELVESEGCSLHAKFVSEMEANDYVIDKVIDTYLVMAIYDLKKVKEKR